MGDMGEGYEDGTMYSSVFTGHFSGLNKVDEYAYEMVMSDICQIILCSWRNIKSGVERNYQLIHKNAYIQWEEIEGQTYLKEIPVISKIDTLEFKKQVTFFVGENGTGKSTMIEAIADAYGFNHLMMARYTVFHMRKQKVD
jgi:ABC-type multidrug transport system fused ATPase/permease subunit